MSTNVCSLKPGTVFTEKRMQINVLQHVITPFGEALYPLNHDLQFLYFKELKLIVLHYTPSHTTGDKQELLRLNLHYRVRVTHFQFFVSLSSCAYRICNMNF